MSWALLTFAIVAQEEIVQTVSGWDIRDNRGSCSAITSYEPDVWMRVAYYPARDVATFALYSPRWRSISTGTDYPLRVDFSNDRYYTSQEAEGLVVGEGEDARYGVVTSWRGIEFLNDFAGAAAMEITVRETRLGRFSLRGTRLMATALVRCGERSFRNYPGDPFQGAGSSTSVASTARSTGSTPARLRSGSISLADYPASALRAGASGTTRITISVGANGSATGCTVSGSSGNSALDSTACLLAQRRFRFEPATRNGQPVAGSYSQSVRWVLPEVAPPPLAADGEEDHATVPHPGQPLPVPRSVPQS